ncbi:hypothetical protein EK21DRAFT_110664 [Setomelanomma holmii]|uniref:Uncharacterized protein n=1 Tax=Setomelanomma holmii TaxID=210430 RepID=A0A9P4LLP7_9PLEO|nr:hypothetical protein EK21DRAFT_110664 [Setomelanomma holmii]
MFTLLSSLLLLSQDQQHQPVYLLNGCTLTEFVTVYPTPSSSSKALSSSTVANRTTTVHFTKTITPKASASSNAILIGGIGDDRSSGTASVLPSSGLLPYGPGLPGPSLSSSNLSLLISSSSIPTSSLGSSSSALLQYGPGLPGPSPSSIVQSSLAFSSLPPMRTAWDFEPIHGPAPRASSSIAYANPSSGCSNTSSSLPSLTTPSPIASSLSPSASTLDWKKSIPVYTDLTSLPYEDPAEGRVTLTLGTPPGTPVPMIPPSTTVPPYLIFSIPSLFTTPASTPISSTILGIEPITSIPLIITQIFGSTTMLQARAQTDLASAFHDVIDVTSTSTLTLKTTITTDRQPSSTLYTSSSQATCTSTEPKNDDNLTTVVPPDKQCPYPYPSVQCASKTTLITKTKSKQPTRTTRKEKMRTSGCSEEKTTHVKLTATSTLVLVLVTDIVLSAVASSTPVCCTL